MPVKIRNGRKVFFPSCTSWLQTQEALLSKNVEFIALAVEKDQRGRAIYNFVIVSFVGFTVLNRGTAVNFSFLLRPKPTIFLLQFAENRKRSAALIIGGITSSQSVSFIVFAVRRRIICDNKLIEPVGVSY